MTTTEMTDGLGRLAGIMEKSEFRDQAAWCKNAIEEFRQRTEIVVVTHANYADGADVSAFWSMELAEKAVEEDVGTVTADLERRGYAPKTLRYDGRVEVYAADSNIYYEWQIERTTIIEAAVCEDTQPQATKQYREYCRKLTAAERPVIGVLVRAGNAVSQTDGASPNVAEELMEQVERCISDFRVDAICPHCGKQLYLSDLPQYAYVCYGCDENFFDFEAVHGEAHNGDQ